MLSFTHTSKEPISSILYHLKLIKRCLINTHIKGITVIKPHWNKSMNESLKEIDSFTLTKTLICLSNLIALSKKTPKFFPTGFTQEDKLPRFKPGELATCDDSKTIISVLPSLRWRKFRDIQALTSDRHASRASKPLLLDSRGRYIWVSSA